MNVEFTAMDITPGNTVNIEITATPRAEAARKTLLRVCGKDERMAKLRRVQKRDRPSWQWWQRGGRQWHHQMHTISPVKLTPGSRYEVRATVDVIRDLASVSRWIKVSSN